jgi:hypothetical protein
MMSDAPETPTRAPIGRLVLLGLVVLTGLGLFFVLGRNTPAVVTPAGVELAP